MKHSLVLYYIPITNKDEAKKLASQLLDENLIACANIFPPHEALYKWKGTLEQSSETLVILKTSKELMTQVENRLKELHPYECPPLISIDPLSANESFVEWINEQTRSSLQNKKN